MPNILVIVTVISVAAALSMAIVAVRIAGRERRRSDARIAALEAAIAESAETPRADIPLARPAVAPPPRVESVAPSVAPAPAHIEWREPSDAPSREIIGIESPAPIGAAADMFAATPYRSSAPRLAIAAIVVVLAAGAMAATILTRDAESGARDAAAAAIQPDAPALELVSLRHDRSGSTWTITGLVRNGAGKGEVQGLIAVAFLFDRTGGFIASGRAPLDIPNLGPGDESPFSVRVDTPDDVARYRVSFRTADGTMLKHLDRR